MEPEVAVKWCIRLCWYRYCV